MWLWSSGPAAAADKAVVIPQDEFVTMLGQVDLLKKKLANADQQLTLYRRVKTDHQQLITLDQQHIAELEAIIRSHEEAGKVAEALLADCEAERKNTQWTWGGGGFATGAALATAVVLWIVN